jgi:hypothetical protein
MPPLLADEGSQHQRHAFTHYLRRLSVQLDPDQYPGETGRLVWDKALHDREHREALQLRRLGTRAVEVAITLELDHQPAQYRLSKALQAALGLRGLHSMPFVMQMLWGYIKAKQLYEVKGSDADEPHLVACWGGERSPRGPLTPRRVGLGPGLRRAAGEVLYTKPSAILLSCALQPSDKGPVCVRCDEQLRPLFGTDSVELGKMADALKSHLTPPEPVQLRYTIRRVGQGRGGVLVGGRSCRAAHHPAACTAHRCACTGNCTVSCRPDGPPTAHPDCYDFEVEVPLR